MSTAIVDVDIVRAWIDVDYREQLTQEQLAALPENPVGTIEGIATDDFSMGESLAVSILSPAGCFFTFACTGNCCAG